jgi:ribonuclease HII
MPRRGDKTLVAAFDQELALEKIADHPAEHILGIDEVGMGCWAGPVVVAGVVLPKGWSHPKVKDSKKLSPKQRVKAKAIIRHAALTHVVLEASNKMVDEYGIKTVRDWLTEGCALYCLKRYPDALIVQDGDIPVVIDGKPQNMVWLAQADVHVPAVSAASVVAKVHRDSFMVEQHKVYPNYGFNTNMGYGTPTHKKGLETHGVTEIHRRSYKPIKRFLVS